MRKKELGGITMTILTNRHQPAQVITFIEKWLAEHRQFIALKEELLEASNPILTEQQTYDQALQSLYEKVQQFYVLFTLHTEEEERILLPALTNILGEEKGLTTVFTCEHEQIAFHLRAFLNCAKPRSTKIPLAAAKSLIFHIIELDERLCEHIKKEESIVYPFVATEFHYKSIFYTDEHIQRDSNEYHV